MNTFFGFTMTQSSAYYRMISFAERMKKFKLLDYFSPDYDPENLNAVVNDFEANLGDPETRHKVCEEITYLNIKKKVKMWIFQPFCSDWGLGLMDVIHRIYAEPILMEIDDYAFGVDSSNPNAATYRPDSDACNKIKKQMQESDALIVSTEELRKLYKPFNPKIYVVPNAIDFDIWGKLKNNKHKTYINIGWQGGSSHGRDLKIIKPVVLAILKKYKNVRFTFLGGDEGIPPEFKGKKRIKWVNDWIPVNKYPAYKASFGFDIELAPLADSQFNRCKSNLRYLEASALKIPTVASDIGPYKDTKADKCQTTVEWVKTLSKLIDDKSLRESKGKVAYKHVQEEYNLDKVSDYYSQVIKKERKEHVKRMKKHGIKAFEEGDKHVYTI